MRAFSRSLRPWYDSPWQIVARAVSVAIGVLIVAAVVFLVAVPRIMGGDSLTVLTGSMEPTFYPGDVLIVKKVNVDTACTDLAIGDIVTFFPEANDPTLITHRITGKSATSPESDAGCEFVTRGDANTGDERVLPEQMRGKFMYGIPKLGWARQWVGENTQAALFVAVAAAIAYGMWISFRKPRSRIVRMPASATTGATIAGVAQPDTVTGSGPVSSPTSSQQGTPPYGQGMPPFGSATYAGPAAYPQYHQGVFPAYTPQSYAMPGFGGPGFDEREMRERELVLREREMTLREQQFQRSGNASTLPVQSAESSASGNNESANAPGDEPLTVTPQHQQNHPEQQYRRRRDLRSSVRNET